MQTIFLTAKDYGPPSVLEYVTADMPQLAPGMARIAVKAAGVNPLDARRMTGEVRFTPLPLRFGGEYAGTIVDLPAGTDGWAIGDAVLGSATGAHATVIDVPIADLVARPATLDWATAGSLAGAGQTAMTMLDEVGAVKSLLIHGASGGVGSITVQLARERGIDVVATASEGNQEYLRGLGATPVRYGPGLTERIARAHPGLLDASIDMIGNEESVQASLARVKPDGELIDISARPHSSDRIRFAQVKRDPRNLAQLVAGVAAGRLQWTVSAMFPFDRAADAYTAMLDGHTRGKSVLVF